MRFDLKELLLVTTIVALYAFGFQLAPIQEVKRIDALWIALPLIQVPGVYFAWCSRRRVGGVIASWRITRMRWAHLALAMMFVVFSAAFASQGLPGQVFLPTMTLTHHIMFAAMAGVAVGQRGVAFGPSFMPWSDFRFALENDHLTWKRIGGRVSVWIADRGRVRIPDLHFEPVRSLLEAKEPQGVSGESDSVDQRK